MGESKNNLVSGGLQTWIGPMWRTDICETCPFLTPRYPGSGGWCSHPSNRTEPSPGWPTGFTPSVGRDGGCDLHPQRQAEKSATPSPEQPR